jgi:hypothetical protein
VGAQGEQSRDGKGSDVTAVASGTVTGTRALRRLGPATEVARVLQRIRRRPPDVDLSDWLCEVADFGRSSVGPDGRSGAFGQLRGHLFEHMDVRDHNVRNAGRRVLLHLREHPHNRAYDATRTVGGRFAGAINHKLGPSGLKAAAAKMEAIKPGSARFATIRVPSDRYAEAVRNAGGRIRVSASRVTTADVWRRAEVGLGELAQHGAGATSAVRVAGRTARRSVATSTILGAALDAPKLRRREMTGKEYAAHRGLDAIEAAISGAASLWTGAAVLSAAETIALAGGVGAAAAGSVAASTLIAPTAAAVVVGVGVTRAAKPLRRLVRTRFGAPDPHEPTEEPVRDEAEPAAVEQRTA